VPCQQRRDIAPKDWAMNGATPSGIASTAPPARRRAQIRRRRHSGNNARLDRPERHAAVLQRRNDGILLDKVLKNDKLWPTNRRWRTFYRAKTYRRSKSGRNTANGRRSCACMMLRAAALDNRY
jgi:hypothetical protein